MGEPSHNPCAGMASFTNKLVDNINVPIATIKQILYNDNPVVYRYSTNNMSVTMVVIKTLSLREIHGNQVIQTNDKYKVCQSIRQELDRL